MIVLLVLLGVFLLLEQLDIRIAAYRMVMRWLKEVDAWFEQLMQTLSGVRSRFTLSDFVGVLLVASMGLLLTWRGRYRFVRSQYYLGETCPRCGGSLKRIHRRTFDRVLGTVLFLHFNRFRCAGEGCGWQGLRRPIRHGRKFKTS